MEGALNSLFYSIQNHSFFNEGCTVLYVNACYHHDLDVFDRNILTVQQHFKPHAQKFMDAGYTVTPMIESVSDNYDAVILLSPKNAREARYMIAQALMRLNKGGRFICAADNNAGGGRLKKILQEFGLSEIDQDSRNKAKLVSGVKDNLESRCIDKAVNAGGEQGILDGQYRSKPGVFGWDKIDTGSSLLVECLPNDIKGCGADFGCGYGYLSHFVMTEYQAIKSLFCADADVRALELCKYNLNHELGRFECLWCDLTVPQSEMSDLDFIIMNPPFHDGKTTNTDIGVSFVRSAHTSLKRRGRLYMVANKQLPYEKILNDLFSNVTKLKEERGFKVYEAVK